MKIQLSLLVYFLIVFSSLKITAQTYPDHFGIGNTVGVTTTSSPIQNVDSTLNSLNGTGYMVDTAGAYRFMAQAGFGAVQEDIDSLQQMGIDNWIDWQMTMPFISFSEKYSGIRTDIMIDMNDYKESLGNNPNHFISEWRNTAYTPITFYDKIINDKDALRQKIAFSLSQIFVINMRTIERRQRKGDAYARYYDIFYEGAFSNFRDILNNVTLSPVMGDFLSYMSNKKEEEGIKPDENFAREIMQLFTIGLYELNNNGTQKLDLEGNPIPTYEIEDIEEMAQVFTGLSGANIDTTEVNIPYTFGLRDPFYDWNLPMVMFQNYHDTSTKILPNGDIIAANQEGMLDIEMTLDYLFNHPNVGPFIARRLIQQMVKSNPTPEYINRISLVFNNNGFGIRGDMGAVCKAILLDVEARDCIWMNHPHAGRLLQPMERNINLMKTFKLSAPNGTLRLVDYHINQYNRGEENYTLQAFLKSPTVFNFFSPDYAEQKFVEPEGLVSPEFEILNSVSSIHYLNRTRDMTEKMGRFNNTHIWTSLEEEYSTSPFVNMSTFAVSPGMVDPTISTIYIKHDFENTPALNFETEVCICEAEGVEALLDHLDLVLCRGQLSTQTKNFILNNITTTDLVDYQNENTTNYPGPNGDDPSSYYEPRPGPTHIDYTCLDEENPYAFDCLRKVRDMVYFIMVSPDYTILR